MDYIVYSLLLPLTIVESAIYGEDIRKQLNALYNTFYCMRKELEKFRELTKQIKKFNKEVTGYLNATRC